MIQSIFNFIGSIVSDTSLNGTLAICLYWIPLLVCLVGYIFDFIRDYKADAEKYQEPYYNPKLTVGSILGRLIITILPVCNLAVAIFKHLGKIIRKIIEVCADFLDIPIIRHRPKPEIIGKP